MFERLLGADEPVSAAEALAGAGLAELAPADRPYVFFNFVSTIDGRVAVDGRTRRLGDDADREMFFALREVADAVLVGPGTARAERYRRILSPERRPGPPPPAVLISRSFDIPWDIGLFAAADQPVVIYTTAGAGPPPDVAAEVEVVRLAECTPPAVLADLRKRGVRALLSEGGPTLFHGFMAAGVVDELFLTLSAMLTGDAAEISLTSGPRFEQPAHTALRWILRAGDELFLRYAIVR